MACLAEAARVLRVGGRISVYDKFVGEDTPHGALRAAIARAVDLVFTTSKVRFIELLETSGAPLVVEHREESTAPFDILVLATGRRATSHRSRRPQGDDDRAARGVQFPRCATARQAGHSRRAGAALSLAFAAVLAGGTTGSLWATLPAASAPAPQPAVVLPPGVQAVPVEDVLALTPAMRAWVHAQVPATLPPIERLDLLVRRLQAPDGAAMRYDAWFTASAAEAFAAHRFNCLSFSHLLVAMAREVGLDAYYLEARYRQRYDREGDLVLLAGHITVGWGDGPRRWVVDFGNEARLEKTRVRRLDDRRALALHYANLGAADLRHGDPRGVRAAWPPRSRSTRTPPGRG